MTRTRAILTALLLTIGLTVPAVILAAPAYAWTCSDGYCHAISHRSPDDGYDDPIGVKCGVNMAVYWIAEGQNSQALGCNDVNAYYLRPGHSLNCYIGGAWTELAENPTGTGYWGTFGLSAWMAGTTYLCVDAKWDTIGGGGGGGGGGGTWLLPNSSLAGGGGGGSSW